MAHTYSGDPATSIRDRIRFELADTGGDALGAWKFRDEEIASAVVLSGQPTSWQGGAAMLARQFARRLDSMADIHAGSLTIEYKRMADAWRVTAEDLELSSDSGPSTSDLPAGAEFPVPMFSKGMHDNPGFRGRLSGSRYT